MGINVLVTCVGEARIPLVNYSTLASPNDRYKFIGNKLNYQIVYVGPQVAMQQLRSNDNYQMVICEFGDGLVNQNGKYVEGLAFLLEARKVTNKRDIPLMLISDYHTRMQQSVLAAIHSDVSLYVEKPVNRTETIEEMVRRGAEMGIDKNVVPFLRVMGFSKEFHVAAREEARKRGNIPRLYFTTSNVKVPDKKRPYQVRFAEKHANTRNPDEYWLDFIPENRHQFAALALDVDELFRKTEKPDTQARREFFIGGPDVKAK